MPLVITVEDGTIVAGANSYIALADCDAYHLGVNAAWAAGSEDNRKGALVRAARSLDRKYRWRGYKVNPATQRMEWPRVGVMIAAGMGANNLTGTAYEYPANEIPQAVKDSQCELALRELATPGSTMPDLDPNTRRKVVKAKAGPAETETEYSESSDLTVAFQTVDGLLSQAGLIGSLSTVELVRG